MNEGNEFRSLGRWLSRQIDIDKVSDEEIQDFVINGSHALKMARLQDPFPGNPKVLGNTRKSAPLRLVALRL
jgi:hypothetical protein